MTLLTPHVLAFSCRIDGHPLEIKKLRGEEPVESIDLSNKGLKVGSAIIIGSLIASNTATKSLKYAATQMLLPLLSAPIDVSLSSTLPFAWQPPSQWS